MLEIGKASRTIAKRPSDNEVHMLEIAVLVVGIAQLLVMIYRK